MTTYAQFAEHTETFLIGGVHYEVTANFVNNTIVIQGPLSYNKFDMNEYMDFEGNMEEFATSKVG